jgi:hypothetical protein
VNTEDEQLRAALADLAEESTPVDLYDHVIRTSRRLRRQRAALVSVAATALIGVTAATVPSWQVSPRPAHPAGAGRSQAGEPVNGPHTVTIDADRVRTVDSTTNRNEFDFFKAALTVDGNPATVWQTDRYTSPDFGTLKVGMGIWLDLRSPRRVDSVDVRFSRPGATAELRAGTADPGSSPEGDAQVLQSYPVVGEPQVNAPATTAFPGSTEPARYLVLWLTRLPKTDEGNFQAGIKEITVRAW